MNRNNYGEKRLQSVGGGGGGINNFSLGNSNLGLGGFSHTGWGPKGFHPFKQRTPNV